MTSRRSCLPSPRRAAFYRADRAVFEACDDSDGLVGDVCRVDACALFSRYAARVEDKQWLAGCLFELLGSEEHGVRDWLLQRMTECLPEPALRGLADRMLRAASAAGLQPPAWSAPGTHWLLRVEEAARRLKDPGLLEHAIRLHDPELGIAACTDVAEVWLAAGEPGASFMLEDREALLARIHDASLARGRSPAYGHGARYLARFAILAQPVTEWGDQAPRAADMAELQTRHGRQTSFWARWREVVG